MNLSGTHHFLEDFTCTEVTGLTREQCEQGQCDVNPALDPTACAAAGTCSNPCPGCTKTACEATVVCNTDPLKEYLDSKGISDTGACFGPFLPDHTGIPYCEDGSTGEVPWGMFCPAPTRLIILKDVYCLLSQELHAQHLLENG